MSKNITVYINPGQEAALGTFILLVERHQGSLVSDESRRVHDGSMSMNPMQAVIIFNVPDKHEELLVGIAQDFRLLGPWM